MKKLLKKTYINTPLGQMISLSDDKKLYFLDFFDNPDLDKRLYKLSQKYMLEIIKGKSLISQLIECELGEYFEASLKSFKTPFELLGTDFQKSAWNALLKVEYGQRISYASQASIIGNPKAFRAVAIANGANNLPIIIPCHRIINKDGKLGGYNGLVWRKEKLLELELGGL